MSSERLPGDFVASGLALAQGSYLFGVPLTSLTRDELLAAAAHGWNSEKRARKQAQADMEFLFVGLS